MTDADTLDLEALQEKAEAAIGCLTDRPGQGQLYRDGEIYRRNMEHLAELAIVAIPALLTRIDSDAALIAEQKAEIEQLAEYTRKATILITGLAGGGSEMFAGQIGGVFVADLPFCKQRIEDRSAAGERLAEAKVLRAKESECEALRNALDESGKTQVYLDGFDACIKTVNSILIETHDSPLQPGIEHALKAVSGIVSRARAALQQKGSADAAVAAYNRTYDRALAEAGVGATYGRGAASQPSPAPEPDGWQDISTMPTGDELILAWVPPDANFPDGRMMIWNASILARQVIHGGRTPEHLQYPATHWRHLPPPPVVSGQHKEEDGK